MPCCANPRHEPLRERERREMATGEKRRRSLSPPPTALAASSSSTNHVAVASSSSAYFLPELIPLVASRLTTLQDFFALRATCRAYRALLQPTPSNLASQAPHMLVPHFGSGSDALFHLPLRRILRFCLPRTSLTFDGNAFEDDENDAKFPKFYSLGCRVAIKDSCRELRIIHLLTGEQTLLPELPKSFDSVHLSSNLVLACKSSGCFLQYYRLGDAHWRVASCGEPYRLDDLIFVKSTLYALVSPGHRLAVVEFSDNNSMEFTFLGGELDAQIMSKSCFFNLAECRGELMLITDVHHVFRWQSGEKKWARTTSLGGCTLFFANYRFAGCLGPDHPGIQRDCIYFTAGIPGEWYEYSLVDGSFAKFRLEYPGCIAMADAYAQVWLYYNADALVWVLPSICL